MTKVKNTIIIEDIDNEDVSLLLKFYKDKLQTLINQNREIFSRFTKYQSKIKELEQLPKEIIPVKKIEVGDKYPENSNWKKKVSYILKTNPKGLTIKEIIDKAMKIENISRQQKRKIYNNVSSAITSGYFYLKIYDRKKDDSLGKKYIYFIK